MQETRVQSLGWEDPLEKEMATHSSTLAWRIPWTEEPGRLQSMGSQRVRHDWVTSLIHSLILHDILWDTWICALASDINLGKIVILLSNIASVPFFFLLLVFPERNVCYTFCSCPKVLEYSVILLLFYLLFSWRISTFLLPQAQRFFP